jgi:predicted porin
MKSLLAASGPLAAMLAVGAWLAGAPPAAAQTAAGAAPAASVQTNVSLPAAAPPPQAACAGVADFFTTDCPLTYYGVTFYGTVDAGGAYQTHGTRLNPAFTAGTESLIQKNSNHALWTLAPNGLSQSNVGIRGTEEFVPGWSFVFDLEAGFDPYSLQLANGPKSMVQNDGVALKEQNSNADSSRAGQFYNSLGFAGISSPTFGTLTAGRVNSLTLDGVIAYDPMAASYAFSPIGWSGTAAGSGDTEDTRFTTAVKYRLNVENFRAAALYQFGGYGAGNASSTSYDLQAGGDFLGGDYGKLALDAIYSHVDGAVSAATLTAAQQKKFPGTLAATISDNTSAMLMARYTYGAIKLYAGYEHILFQNPDSPQSAFTNIGGYTVAAADITNTAYNNNKILHIFWGGVKYAITDALDITGAYYHYIQENYATVACSNISSSKCSGTLDAISAVVDWRFAPKVDAYAGVMLSEVNNGLANGYLYHTTIDPTVGLRFRF